MPAVPSVLCVDVGSTFTKAVLVDVVTGEVLGTASHPTTVSTDVMDGVDAVRAALAGHGEPDDVLVCSSAGGGLRLAVVGYEREVTAEAGHRVGLSAGAKVVHVACGPMTGADVAALRAASPDLVLLVGGTDGGNADVLLHNAERIARSRLSAPVVVAGNADAAGEVAALLASTGRRHVVTANVLPRIGVVAPEAARAAIREAFLTHVIGGKGLSRGRGFAELVRAPTPDAVLRGVEVLADVVGGDVLVVDVGGATTDVYSVITPQGEDATIHREVVGTLWHARTVEADLGMRWNAEGVVEAGERERISLSDNMIRYATAVAADPAHLASSAAQWAAEEEIASTAAVVAVRRHGRPPHPSERPRPLAEVALVVGSGGVLRHAPGAMGDRVLARVTDDHGGGWRVPDARTPTRGRRLRALRGGAARPGLPRGGRGPRGAAGRSTPGDPVAAAGTRRAPGAACAARDGQWLSGWPPIGHCPPLARPSGHGAAHPSGMARNYGVAMSTDWPWAEEFEAEGTYLNSATMGLPPRATLAALAVAQDEWRRGTAHAPGYDADVAAARGAYARLVGVPPETVAIGSQVSPQVAMVAAAVPDGSTVLVPEGEFTSVTFPFLAQEARGIRVVEVPLAQIAEHVDASTALVALAAVQSSDGAVAPLDAVEAAAARHGVDVLVDVTQAAGWLPLEAGRFAYTVCAAYKWLLSPRGTAFLTVRPDRWERLVPAAAGWYAGEQPWSSIYGTPLRLASDARRYDVSPGWHAWVGTASSLALLERVGVPALHAHALQVEAAFAAGAGLEPVGRAIRALAADEEVPRLLAAHGIVAAERAGRLRVSFHLNNTEEEATQVGALLRGHVGP